MAGQLPARQASPSYKLSPNNTRGSFILDLETILKNIAHALVKDLGFKKGAVIVFDKQPIQSVQSCHAGFTEDQFRLILTRLDDLLAPALGFNGQEIKLAGNSRVVWQPFLNELKLSSLLLLPLRVHSRLIGFIVGGHSQNKHRMSKSQRQFYSMYALRSALAIDTAQRFDVLGKSNASLKDQVKKRTEDLVEANERLRELDTIKSNFIALVSHELRTPLTAIKGFTSTLLHFNKEISTEKRQLYLEILNQETDRLTRLITELLDISQIESGRIEIHWQRVDVAAIVKKVFSALSRSAPKVQFELNIPSEFPLLHADPEKIEEIFSNVLGNALRFAPPETPITVTGRALRDAVLIEVRDLGPGIPFSDLEKVFDKFYRQDNEINRKNPGTGLGLPISRALANLHGGKIWIEHDSAEGCRLRIILPLNLHKPLEVPSGPISLRVVPEDGNARKTA